MPKRLFRLLPIAVTVVALGVALDRFNLTQLWRTAAQLPVWVIAVVVVELLAGNLLASMRVKILAEGLSQSLRFRDAVVATASGNLAGSFFFQIIGQTIARSAVLSKVGISVPTTIIVTGYERVVAGLVSLSLALGGAFFLFRHITFDLACGGLNLIVILAGITTVALSGALFAWGHRAWRVLRTAATMHIVLLYFRVSIITVLIQATTMIAYVAAASSLSSTTPLIDLVAATTLVMFAASVPVSLAGWGLREISAVYALGAIGMPYQAALVVALLIGFSSIIVMAIIALVSAQYLQRGTPARSPTASQPPSAGAAPSHATFLNWFIPLLAASAVFFQIHLPVGMGKLDVNLADSVVLFGGALFVLRALARGASRPTPRIPWLGKAVGLMSLIITLAFVHGLFVVGWTSWAFTNRLFGWLVLLAYAGTGGLLALEASGNGLQMLLRTFVASGLAVAVFELILLLALALGVPIPESIAPLRMDGFAQNPNAFGFQLLLVIAAITALRISGRRLHLALAVAFMALYFTASRAAEGTAVVLFAFAIALGYVSVRSLFTALGYAAAGVGIIFLTGWAASALPALVAGLVTSIRGVVVALSHGASPTHIYSAATVRSHAIAAAHSPLTVYFSTNATQLTAGDYGSGLNVDRWVSLIAGIRMFFAHPIFGAGLGVFVEEFERVHGRFLVIHSTPIWLLATAGIAGFLVFAVPGVMILRREIRRAVRGMSDSGGILLVLSLLAFGVMSQVHELLYQRTLWLVLGAALVVPALEREPRRSGSSTKTSVVAAEELIKPAAPEEMSDVALAQQP